MFKNIAHYAGLAVGMLAISTPFMVLAVVTPPPSPAPGVTDPNFSNLFGILSGVGGIVNLLVSIAIAAALLFFIWGLAQYILSSGDPEAKDNGKKRMIQGIIALFVIVSIWGIIAFIGKTTGIDQGGTTNQPGAANDYVIPGVGN